MSQLTQQSILEQLRFIRSAPGLPFSNLLDPDLVKRVIQDEQLDFRDRLYSPMVAVHVFLAQVLSPDHSCREAVARLVAHLAAQGATPCSPETGSYCKARQRLPETVVARLSRETGQRLHADANPAWRWKGRRVKLVDGTTVSMPDTLENQAAFPQSSSQLPGLGFPIARLLSIHCHATGAVVDLTVGSYQGKETGETAMLRSLMGRLQAGDVLVADRYFCSYFMIALLCEAGVDILFRMHQLRHFDFRRGQRLGNGDHVVRWKKPKRPNWLDEETFARLPATLVVREIRLDVNAANNRTKELILVTTLLDAQEYPKDDLATLYYDRWNVELDLRSIKAVMQMDVLRGKTPEIVRKEIWMHMLAYNLISALKVHAAQLKDLQPRAISFKGTLQTLTAFREVLTACSRKNLPYLCQRMLTAIAAHRVGDRPGRQEPRAIKRRPKPHDLLTVPRSEARKRLLHKT